jgi:CBS domain-containing protein
MRPVDIPVIESQISVRDALTVAEEHGASEVLVDDPPFGWSSVTTESLRDLVAHQKDATVAEILPVTRMPQIYPDNRLEVALRRIGQWPFLPVMHRADPKQLVGLISMRDVMGTFVE